MKRVRVSIRTAILSASLAIASACAGKDHSVLLTTAAEPQLRGALVCPQDYLIESRLVALGVRKGSSARLPQRITTRNHPLFPIRTLTRASSKFWYSTLTVAFVIVLFPNKSEYG